MVVCGKDGVDMGCKYDLDDDAYYAEIEKQILELTADDGEDDIVLFRRKASGCGGSDSIRVNQRSNTIGSYALPHWSSFKKSGNGGTGVFIPQIANRSIPTESPPESETKNVSGKSRRCRQKGKSHNQLGSKSQGGQIKSPLD